MKSYKTIFILSLILILLPLIGIYSSWKEIVIFTIGLYFASLALSLWRKAKQDALILNNRME